MLPATPNILLGEPFIELATIDSTNIYAMDLVHKGLALSGSCIRAQFQSQGKGQHGRNWESSAGLNLLCSYILALKQLNPVKIWSPSDQMAFSAAIALGVRSFFEAFAGGKTKIKKPNDIYWGDRKAGGILIENVLRGQAWTWSVVGIGINIHQMEFSHEAGQPISLKQITGETYQLGVLQKALSLHLNNAIMEWLSLGDLPTLEKWEAESVIIKK